MSHTVIRVEDLGKKYTISHQQERQRYQALRDVIVEGVKGLTQRLQNPKAKLCSFTEEFWALKQVSFEVKQGDRIGVIGRNGAGKSTLLKVLSRITEPTTGKIGIKGRIASLLEVGTGFHPELTGRENIFLNGAILGMSKSDIHRNFDEIVAFAEVEKFLDTPVKRYSSGMYVRLAFAVAAHLEPEILVVDEVLAVGDLAFQRKCLGKMKDVSQEGRTVLFVSHNMAAIQSLCNLGLLLNQGETQGIKPIDEAIQIYESSGQLSQTDLSGNDLKYFNVHDLRFTPLGTNAFRTFGPAKLTVAFSGKDPLLYADIYVSIRHKSGQTLAGFRLRDISEIFSIPEKDFLEATFEIESLPLMPGEYELLVELKDLGRNRWEYLPEALEFEVADTPVYGTQSTRAKSWYGSVGLRVEPQLTVKANTLIPCQVIFP
jgi:lipopolysaccharide transport system ATP-binding protein